MNSILASQSLVVPHLFWTMKLKLLLHIRGTFQLFKFDIVIRQLIQSAGSPNINEIY